MRYGGRRTEACANIALFESREAGGKASVEFYVSTSEARCCSL